MRRTPSTSSIMLLGALLLAGGCSVVDRGITLTSAKSDAQVESIRQIAARVDFDHPAEEAQPAPVALPRPLVPVESVDPQEIHLSDAVRMALEGEAIIREPGSFLAEGSTLMTNPEQVPSGFDVDIQEAGGPAGGRGIDAAFADFDPVFTTGLTWIDSELVQNNQFLSGGLIPGAVLQDETAVFISRLDKPLLTGGVVSLSHNWNYSSNNVPSRLYDSAWVGFLRAEYRQPLLAGSGREFVETAGPRFGGFNDVQVDRGIAIARINTDISVAEFERQMQVLVKNVEDLYWDLHLAYGVYEREVAARDDVRAIWKKVKGRADAGLEAVGAADEAQARQQLLSRELRVQAALANLYETESRLRRLLDLPANDGRLLKPIDPPDLHEPEIQWEAALSQALARRVELRQQQARIQSLSLQLCAARTLERPNLDAVMGAQLNGFGDNLVRGGGSGTSNFGSAYRSLLRGDQTGWDVGLQLSMPIGYRRAAEHVRNLELRLAKAKAAAAAQEEEITHELSVVLQRLEHWSAAVRTSQEMREAAQQQLRAVAADYEAGRTSLDLLLRTRIALIEAESEHLRSVAAYQRAMAELDFRTGAILERNSIELAEASPESAHPSQQPMALSGSEQPSTARQNRLGADDNVGQ